MAQLKSVDFGQVSAYLRSQPEFLRTVNAPSATLTGLQKDSSLNRLVGGGAESQISFVKNKPVSISKNLQMIKDKKVKKENLLIH